MTELKAPRHWQTLRLQDVLDTLPSGGKLEQGWSPQCDKVSAGPEEWGVLKTTAIQAGAFLDQHHKRLPPHFEARPGLEVKSGDLLLTNAGPRARCAVPCLVRSTRGKLMLSGKVYRFRALDSVMDPRFLELYLLSPATQHRLDRMKTGISDSGLNLTRAKFLDLPVAVPELVEQRRIVDLLEDLLSRLDAAVATLEQAARRAEAMYRGGLWQLTHGVGGDEFRLDEVADVRLGRQRSPSNHSGTSMRSYLRAGNVDWDLLRLDDVKQMNFTSAEEATFELAQDDILVVEASGSAGEVGKSALYRGEAGKVCFQNTLLRVRCLAVDPEFMQKYLLAEAMNGRFLDGARGVGIHHIGKGKLAAWPVLRPPLDVQRQAVEAADALTSSKKRLVVSIKEATARGSGLRRSLLAAAFSGRLSSPPSSAVALEPVPELS